MSVVPARQSLPARVACAAILTLMISDVVVADLFDSLDAFPPRWQLDTSDCDARVSEQKNLTAGGSDGGGCETVTFTAGVGSESILIYPIEPVHPLNDLVANVSVMSARQGARVGLRVRFPYLRDAQTHRPISTIIYGATYQRPGTFQQLGIGSIERELRVKIAKLRGQHGNKANLDDPYVDAVAINAYSGPGTTTLRIDQIKVRGMVAVGDHGRVDEVPLPRLAVRADALSHQLSEGNQRASIANRMQLRRIDTSDPSTTPTANLPSAYPQDAVIRILEHHDEPLPWVRSLGFDAILLSRPPTAEILRQAIQTQLLVYAPPPIAPDPTIQTLLDPVMAWYLGGGVALDSDRISQTDATVRRLRSFPVLWQRPIVIAPVERWASYATLSDGIVSDAPPRSRGLPASEQSEVLQQRRVKVGNAMDVAIAIASSPPANLATMNQSIEAAIGAPPDGCFRWHSMFTQVIQSLEHAPRAIVFRSHASLVSGSSFAHQRSMALSYVNRVVAMISPWLAAARPLSPLPVEGANYRCGRLQVDGDEFLLLSSQDAVSDQVLAGDGKVVSVQLPPGQASRTAWRLTDFAAERINIESTATGAQLQLVSPDVVEIVVISSDAALGTRLNQSAMRFAGRAASDRWQLCGDQIQQVRQSWNHAVASGATNSIVPVDLLTASDQTMREAETVYRAGDAESTLRLSRRADAWANRAAVQLTQALQPTSRSGQPLRFVSCPPIDQGRPILQTAWQPLMQDEGWSSNLIALGGLDQPNVLSPENWTFGRRQIARANSDATWISRGFFSGRGAIKLTAASVAAETLGGGYEGTIAMLSSPKVKIRAGQAVRLDVMVRTIGFGAAHQGLLVYDSLGGQEMGVLVRGAHDWTPVRLYRQSSGEDEVNLMFEVIGDGEAIVDEVSVKVWDPEPLAELPLQSLAP